MADIFARREKNKHCNENHQPQRKEIPMHIVFRILLVLAAILGLVGLVKFLTDRLGSPAS